MKTYSRIMRLCLFLSCSIAAWNIALSQQPFDLDTTFRTEINTWYVSSVAPLQDGRVFLSGMINYPSELPGIFRGAAMLLPNGQRDVTFPNFPYTIGAGKITPWNDQFYVATTQTVRRLTPDCLIDTEFIQMNQGPYFSSLQGGDYHVYPDGRILMSGVHRLEDTLRGFDGYYCLIWFSNTGYLDTTKTHRTCAGSLNTFTELPNGQFIGSGSTSIWDGQQASNIIRFNADGSLDNTFQANVYWGQAYGYLPLPDGRVYAGGNFRITGIPDTLQLVRFMPDGSLDPTFNNYLQFDAGILTGSGPGPNWIYLSDEGRLIVSGGFQYVAGESRGGICLLDTNGMLLNDYFSGTGGGTYNYQTETRGTVRGIAPAPDGSYYIWGSYHGYDDGTTNDTNQRMVSLLHGLDVGISENAPQGSPVVIYPNPGVNGFTINLPEGFIPEELTITDQQGRTVFLTSTFTHNNTITVSGSDLLPGLYGVALLGSDGSRSITKWVVQ